jgi:hypothetical protein
MNLQSWSSNVAEADRGAAVAGLFRQIRRVGLWSTRCTMWSSARAPRLAMFFVGVLAVSAVGGAQAQTNYYSADGGEYAVIGSLPGDQVMPSVAISTSGGLVAWQDNITDGEGWGISARRLDSTLSGTLSTFRVNVTGAGDQENVKVASLKNGGAVFAWQGGIEGFQHIFARFLTPTNTFLSTTDLPVSTFRQTNNFQVNPSVAVLANSNVVVTWASFNQAGSGSLLDVYAKILSPSGQTISNEFLVNQFTNYNQRTPAVAALASGGFVIAWVSEQERVASGTVDQTNGTAPSTLSQASVDIYARMFSSNGAAAGNEFLVNEATIPCANPAVAAGSDGSFAIAWSGRDTAVPANGWDVYQRTYSRAGVGNTPTLLNTHLAGNQYAPQLAAIGGDYLGVWTSLGQDGSREGVYGQFFGSTGLAVGSEFRVNTTTISEQMEPAIASDGAGQFLAVWTSYMGPPYSFDLYAQRYVSASSVLSALSAPYVWAPFVTSNNGYQPELVVTWAAVQGLAVSNYEVYVNSVTTPAGVVTTNAWVMTAADGLTASSTNWFAVDYVTADGSRSPLSPSASGTTWSGYSWYGIPFEWMAQYYGASIGSWPGSVATPLTAGGPSLYQVFLSGGIPTNSATWLTQKITPTAEGAFLNWNTQAGATYQVQFTTDFSAWSNVGSPRFAAGTNDSVYVGGNAAGYYRVELLRQ